MGPGDSLVGRFLAKFMDNDDMKRTGAFSCLFLVLAMVGCTAKPSLLGNWQDTETRTFISKDNPSGIQRGPKTVNCFYEFRSDGSGTFECTNSAVNVTQKQYFRYSVSGDSMTSTYYDIKVSGNMDESRRKRLIESYKKTFGKPQVSKISFIDERTLEVGTGAGKMGFVRIN